MPVVTPIIVATSLELVVDSTANDSDKVVTVDSDERWHTYAIYVSLTTTSTVGNRQMQIDFRDGAVIDAQDETSYDNSPTTEGVFFGGTGHSVSDVLTLSDRSTVTVDAVSAGVITQFTVASTASSPTASGTVLTQLSTTGSGLAFTLTPDVDNVGNVICSVFAGVTQAASLTYTYSFAPGLSNLTTLVGTSLNTPLPPTMLLLPGYDIRIFDNAAVAAAADDMTIRVLVDRVQAHKSASL